MRIGASSNLMIHLIRRDVFEAGQMQTPPPQQLSQQVFQKIETEAGSKVEDSCACDSVSQTGTDVPRPGDDGYPSLPTDATTSVGFDPGASGSLLDVMA